jgi:hypothetical protein
LIRNWALDFALFHAAYPGQDPLRFTIRRFRAWIQLAPVVHSILKGTLKSEQLDELNFERIESKLILQAKFDQFKLVV